MLAPSPEDLVELGDEHAISQRPNHYTFRTTFLRAALDRLACVQTGGYRDPAPGPRDVSARTTVRRRQRRLRLSGATLRYSEKGPLAQ